MLEPKHDVILFTQNLDRSLNRIRRKEQNLRGSDNGKLSRTLNLAARGLQWEVVPSGYSRARMRGLSQAKAPGMQKQAGAEPKKQSTRLGLRNQRERAGRGKGRQRRAKRGSYGRAGEGGGAGLGGGHERTGRREGARVRSWGRARPQQPRGRGEAQARPRQSAPGYDETRGGQAQRKPAAARSGQEAETRCRNPSPWRQDSHLLAAEALR